MDPHSLQRPSRVVSSRLSRWRSALLALALGALAEACFEARFVPLAGERSVAWWVADRAGHRVLGLDADLLSVQELRVDWPLEVEVAASGKLGILRAINGRESADRELLQLHPLKGRTLRTRIGEAHSLRALGGAGWVCIEGDERLLHVDSEGLSRCLAGMHSLAGVAVGGRRILIGSSFGALRLLEWNGVGLEELCTRTLGEPLRALARGPGPHEWWALVGAQRSRLVHLDSGLQSLWQQKAEVSARFVAAAGRRAHVWLADHERSWAGVMGADAARPPTARPDPLFHLPTIGFEAGAALPSGGVLLLAPGSLLHLDGDGRLRPGQGGLKYAVDLARAQ